MIFPGMATQYSPTSHPCATQPNSTPYYTANIKYQIGTALDATYNNGSGSLVNSSPLVQAVGDVTATPKALTGCVTAKGGEGSYAAEVLTKAQAALPVVAGTKNVIIFLSDGDFNASASQLNNQTSKTSKQCDQAIAAAQAATAAGTTVYSVAYGAPTSGCSSRATPTIRARRCRRSPPTRPRSTRRARAARSPVLRTPLLRCPRSLPGNRDKPDQAAAGREITQRS